MEKKHYCNRVFIINAIAVVLFILSLFFNVFSEITRFEENVGGPDVTYTPYKGYELILFDFDVGIPFGSITLVLAIVGVLIGLKKMKLSQVFVSSGISLAFAFLTFFVEASQIMIAEENDTGVNGIYALEREYSLEIGLGYIFILLSFILIIVSSLVLILDNKKKMKVHNELDKKTEDVKIANQ